MKRSEIKEEMKWDLSSLYKSESDFDKDFKYLEDNYLKYKDFEGKLNNSKTIYDFFVFDEEFNPIFTNKIKKFVTNIKDFTDSSNTLRHKKTLSFNGDIFPLHKLNRTSSSSLSKTIKKNKSNNMDNMNILKKRYKNKSH